MTISKAARRAIEDRISYLEDNAYRYRHLGGSLDQIIAAEKQEKEAAELKVEIGS